MKLTETISLPQIKYFMGDTFYNHNSILGFGKHKFKKIKEVPISYLLKIGENPKGCNDKWLADYVLNNLEFLKAIGRGEKSFPEDEEDLSCKKQYFTDQKAAKVQLGIITKSDGGHKKLIRTYRCDKCTGWHLTSIPLEDWKMIQKNREVNG